MQITRSIVTLVAMLGASPASAQVHGIVVDAAERPVAGAVVEVWSGTRAAGGTRSGDDGRFETSPAAGAPPLTLTVRRMGFETRTIVLAPSDTALRVRMEARAVALGAVTVAAAPGRLCPRAEDARARTLWERMRRRYWQPADDSVSVFSFAEIRTGTGEKADAFSPAAGRTSAGWTQGPLVVAHPGYMRLSGYADRASGGAGDRTAFWLYRALDDGAMQDFTGDYFGEAHALSLLHAGAEETVIAFCPRDRPRETGVIEGTLVLRADTTLARARWIFRTPRPDEDAGGEASYASPEASLGRALLAEETVFWRRTTGGRYWFDAETFTAWRRWNREDEPSPASVPR